MSNGTDNPISQKQGVIKKCPSCGGALKAFVSSCELCGHELADVAANKTIAYLSEKFDGIGSEVEKLGLQGNALEKEITLRKARVIRDFPIPNSREDLQSLIYFIHPKIQYNAKPDPNREDWRVKFKEVMTLARNAYKDDAKTRAEFDEIERSLKTTAIDPIKRNPIIAICLGVGIALAVIGVGVSQYGEWQTAQCQKKLAEGVTAERTRLGGIAADVESKIGEKKFTEAKAALNALQWGLIESCNSDESLQEKNTWKDKQQALLLKIQGSEAAETAEKNSIVQEAEKAEQAKKKAEADREQAEKRAITEREMAKKREQIDRDMEDSLSSRARAAASRK